jgi:Tfp pilus assembly protein PilE
MKRLQTGLTFLELTAWILIVGVLALLAAPKYMEMTAVRTPAVHATDR